MAYGSEFYRSIELGIRATGQQGVDALANSMHAAERAFGAFQAQVKASSTVTAQQVKELADLKAAADRATEAYSAATRVIAGKSAEARGGIEGITNATLQLSRGLEDLSTGGFLGVLNNLPGIGRGVAQSFGLAAPQVAAVETAVSLLGTGSYLLYTHWQKLKDLMDDGTGPKLLPDLRAINKEIEELRSKPLPSLIDQQDIKNLERTADQLGRIDASLKAMKGPTSDESKRSKIVQEAVRESGGLEAVVKAYGDATQGPETPEEAATRKRIADLQAQENAAAAAGQDDAAALYARNRQDLERTAAGRRAADRANLDTANRRLVGLAGAGDENARRQLAEVYDRNSGVFERNAVTRRLREGLESAGPLKLHAEEQAKIAADAEKDYKAEVDKAVREALQGVRKGFDDATADAIQSALQAGTPLADASKAAKDAILPQLKQRGIGKSIVGAVADEIVKDAASEAQNKIGEGQRSTLQTRRDQAKTRDQNERDRKVDEFVAATRGGFIDKAEADLYRGMKAGTDADELQKSMVPGVAGALRDRGGIPEQFIEATAKKILALAADRAMNGLDSGVAPKLIRQEEAAKATANKKQVSDIGTPFIAYAESLLARNRAAINAGVPVARDEADVQRYRRSGGDFALPEGEARRRIGVDVAQGLRNAGQDPRLAGPMLDQARDRLGDAIAKGMGSGMSEQQVLVNIVNELADQVQTLTNHGGGLLGEIDQLKKKQPATGRASGPFGAEWGGPGPRPLQSPISDPDSKKNGGVRPMGPGSGAIRPNDRESGTIVQPILIPAQEVASALSRLDRRGTAQAQALTAEANRARRQRGRMWARQDRAVKQRPSTIQFPPSFAP